MADAGSALMKAYLNNIERYHRLLQTHLTEVEREYIHARLSDHQSAIKAVLGRGIEYSPDYENGWRETG